MEHMAFSAEEYDAKIRQTLPFNEEYGMNRRENLK